jgi:hypothetical protein
VLSLLQDVNRPNLPDAEIVPTSPLTCLVYNPRLPDHLVGGSYNGLVGERLLDLLCHFIRRIGPARVSLSRVLGSAQRQLSSGLVTA